MLFFLALACDADSQDSGPSAAPVEVVDMASYLARCEQLLGPMPQIDCQAGTEIPITVTDSQGTRSVGHSSELEGGSRCDKPSVAGCGWGSRLGVVQNAQGTNWIFTCRNYDDDPTFDQLNLIATDPESGQTCFLSTKHRDNDFGTGQDLPRPGSEADLAYFEDRSYWYTLEDLGRASCLVCHDNDAILRNPWIEQPGLLPVGAPLGPYEIVAQDALQALNAPDWAFPQDITHPDAAACTQCHRLGTGRSCNLALRATGQSRGLRTAEMSSYPASHWMPHLGVEQILESYPTQADWEATFGLAADTLADCCSEQPSADCFE